MQALHTYTAANEEVLRLTQQANELYVSTVDTSRILYGEQSLGDVERLVPLPGGPPDARHRGGGGAGT